MKNILLLLSVLVTLTATAGPQSNMALGYGKQLLQTPTVQANRSLAFKPVIAMPGYEKDKCRKYRGMLIGGAVTFGVGIGLTATGSAILIQNAVAEANGDNDGLSQEMLIAGGVMLGVGGVATIIGIPFLARGSKKVKEYCGKGNAMNLQFFKQGNHAGLALRF